MAANLSRLAIELAVYDVSPDAVRKFAAEHACRVAMTPADVARGSDVIFLMLPNGKIVSDFLLAEGKDGPVAGLLNSGAIVVDMSSSDPVGTQETGRRLQALGIAMIDAPVSGGVPRAKTGKLAIMVGGDASVADKVVDLLAALGSAMPVGPLGAGHAMKALNNYVSAAGLVAACEALKIAQEFGLESETIVRVLNASTGSNNSTQNKLMQYVVSGKFNSGFSIGLMHKDLRTALELGANRKVEMPMGECILSVWDEAEKKFGGNADHTEIAKLISSR